ncbi:unnamed protein product [Nippostrongylus brasiliensis]|uniref:U4/U6 small nuclear ribonucleoprotein Prp31 (inferred by orthology to a human protein) n=1 Tax=Nippostrongylus brasiliensis TaxID=27835 RepID=A0A0N4YYY8_NIPBR|nr:unnamed protein product [Nippostrongylus brasiliensis]
MKERMGMTDLRKSANRMNFGELAEDVLQDHLGFDLGQVKTGNVAGGRIRAGVVDNKTRVKMSQKMQRQMERQRAQGGVTSIRSKSSSNFEIHPLHPEIRHVVPPSDMLKAHGDETRRKKRHQHNKSRAAHRQSTSGSTTQTTTSAPITPSQIVSVLTYA